MRALCEMASWVKTAKIPRHFIQKLRDSGRLPVFATSIREILSLLLFIGLSMSDAVLAEESSQVKMNQTALQSTQVTVLPAAQENKTEQHPSTEAVMAHQVTPSSTVQLQAHKLLLMPEIRHQMDQQRWAYLRSLQKKQSEVEKSSPVVMELPSTVKRRPHGKKKVRRYVLQSSVRSENGQQMIQINGRWFYQGHAPIRFDVDAQNPSLVRIYLKNRTLVVPVGATFIPQQGKVIWQPQVNIRSTP